MPSFPKVRGECSGALGRKADVGKSGKCIGGRFIIEEKLEGTKKEWQFEIKQRY